MDLSLPLAFTVGLFSTFHCVAMCGGIMGAMSFGLTPELRANWRLLSIFLLTFNLGRIASYTLAGSLFGLLGGALLQFDTAGWLHNGLRWVAAVILVGVGLYIAGWFPQFAQIEKIGIPVWARLQPLTKRLMPVNSLPRALGYGLLWGWLPCGLAYTMLLTTAAQTSPSAGALYMLAFGLGTLPTLMATGLLAGRLIRYARREGLRQLVGLSVVVMGLFTLYYQEVQEPIGDWFFR